MKIILIISLMFLAGYAARAEEEFDPFPQNRGSIYQYSDNDIPDVCFFPVSKARWNGPMITTIEWRMLTDYQKTMFISEYVEELEKKNNEYIDLEGGWEFLIAVNTFVYEYDNSSPVLMTKVLDNLLKEYVR